MRFLVLLATSTWLAVSGAASAATLTVTTTADSDDGACAPALCSLRDAVAVSAAGDVVSVPASPAHYAVTLGPIIIKQAITIQGAGAESTVIDADSRSRIFTIWANVEDTATTTFDSLTLTRGFADLYGGGAVFGEPHSGDKVFDNVVVTDNRRHGRPGRRARGRWRHPQRRGRHHPPQQHVLAQLGDRHRQPRRVQRRRGDPAM